MATVRCSKCPTAIHVADDEKDSPRLCGRCWVAERASKNGTPVPTEPAAPEPVASRELLLCSGGRYVHGVYGSVITSLRSLRGQPLCEQCGGK